MAEQHLDHEALAELKEVMEEDFDILLSTYLNDSQMRIQAMSEGLEQADASQYARSAHSLKGSCINIGAMRLAQLCAIAESEGRAGDLQNADASLKAVGAEFEIVSEQLTSYLKV